MQKPDDIPEDVWAESYEVMYLSRDDEHLRQNIARAILAERERGHREFRQQAMAGHIHSPWVSGNLNPPISGKVDR